MTDQGRPEPLTPSDCDLRGLPFMPVDTVRLFDSDLFALSTGDQFKAAWALWAKSWQQVPAASLPNDDRVLAHLSSSGARWQKVKVMALRGFVECSDGRLYHPVVAEKALEAWAHRKAQRERANRRWDRVRGNAGCCEELNADEYATAHAAAHATAMQGTVEGIVKGQKPHRGPSDLLSGSPPDTKKRTHSPKVNGHAKAGSTLLADARTILLFLNEKAGRRFPETESNLGIIVARMREGFTAVQVRQVVANRVRRWKGDEKMEEFLRPDTLFNRKKFSNYVGELVEVVDDDPLPGAPVDLTHEPQPEAAP